MLTLSLRFQTSTVIFKIPKNSFFFGNLKKFSTVLVQLRQTESGQQTETGQDFPENPDKNETRARYGQGCIGDNNKLLVTNFLFRSSSSELEVPYLLTKATGTHIPQVFSKSKFSHLHPQIVTNFKFPTPSSPYLFGMIRKF